jgi:cytochrome c oxidase subunit II
MSNQPKINVDSVWLPQSSSTIAPEIDSGFYLTIWICVAFFVAVVGAMFYFAWKYKRKSDDERTSPIDHNFKLEVAWSVVPTVLLIYLFWIGIKGYANAQVAPNDSYEIQVTAQMYNWTFQYPDGSISNDLFVPVGRNVKLNMSSKDVIHAFWVPEFRVKQDVVPGLYSSMWFNATRETHSAIECTEYCGDGHSKMYAEVRAMPAATFDEWRLNDWIDPKNPLPPEKLGEKRYAALCQSCHSLDGSKVQGPSFKGIYGKQESFEDGSSGVVDDNYIRQSIYEPQAKIVAGYPRTMPTFKGQLKDRDIEGIIAFLKAQK